MSLGFGLCLDASSFKKQTTKRADYGFHHYFELCQFVYCLLSRSRKVSSLPPLEAWESFMDVSKLDAFEEADMDSFLVLHDFGVDLLRRGTSEFLDFRRRCREFFDYLVEVILSHCAVSNQFMEGIYCFCPELLLEGDDKHVFMSFKKLSQVLERSGSLSSVELKAASEEFVTFVVDVRSRHVNDERSAEDIKDIVAYLVADYGLQSCKNLYRVFRLCCLVVQKRLADYPTVDFDLKNCAVPPIVVTSCIRGVQSCVSAPDYKLSAFFTKHTMDKVREAIASSRDFMSSGTFDTWEGICSGGHSAFVERYQGLFDAYLDGKKKESYQRLRDGGSRGSRSVSGAEMSSMIRSRSQSSSVGSDAAAVSVDGSDKGKMPSRMVSLLGHKKDQKKLASSGVGSSSHKSVVRKDDKKSGKNTAKPAVSKSGKSVGKSAGEKTASSSKGN